MLLIVSCSLAPDLKALSICRLGLFVRWCCTLWGRHIQPGALRPKHLSGLPSTANVEGSPGDNLQALWHYKIPQGHLGIFCISLNLHVFSLKLDAHQAPLSFRIFTGQTCNKVREFLLSCNNCKSRVQTRILCHVWFTFLIYYSMGSINFILLTNDQDWKYIIVLYWVL